MSLEHLKSSGLPYYLYYCGDNDNVFLEVEGGVLGNDALIRHLNSEHVIIDDRVVQVMRNKADCYKKFYLRNAWTFGVVLGSHQRFSSRNRVFIFGARNFEKPFLQKKECNKMEYTIFGSHYLSKMLEISNVDKKKYDQSIRNLIKAVS